MAAWPGQVAAPDSNIFFEFANLANKKSAPIMT
jgi:hypothetical protein